MIMLYGIILAVVGFFQVTFALGRIILAKRQDCTYAIRLKQYLLVVIAYFMIYNSLYQVEGTHNLLMYYLTVPPTFIAIWYTHHVYKWDKKYKHIKEYDQKIMLEVPCKERLEFMRLPKRKIEIIKLKSHIKIAT